MRDTAESHVKTQLGSAVSVRACTLADLPAILTIEHACYPIPWNNTAFLHELHNPYGRFLVAEKVAEKTRHAELSTEIAGYLCSWLIIDEVHILNLAVHPNARRCGIAQMLLRQTLIQARQAGACSANLEVRQSNRAAIAVYRKFGFETVTVRHKYYENGEDGLLMVCSLERLGA